MKVVSQGRKGREKSRLRLTQRPYRKGTLWWAAVLRFVVRTDYLGPSEMIMMEGMDEDEGSVEVEARGNGRGRDEWTNERQRRLRSLLSTCLHQRMLQPDRHSRTNRIRGAGAHLENDEREEGRKEGGRGQSARSSFFL